MNMNILPVKVKALIVYKLFSRLYLLFFCLVLPLLFANTSCSAQTIGNWTLNNTLTGTGSAQNTVGNVSLGPGITSGAYNGGTEYFGEGGWPAGGINTNAYVQFSITPNAGYELDLSGLILRIRRSTTGTPSGSGPNQWSLRSSVDGFAANIASGSLTTSYSNYPVTLTGFLSLPSTVTFRLYGFSATVSTGGMSRLVMDNISIQGGVFILPVHFNSLNARFVDQGNVLLKWAAQDIQAGTLFSVQRSFNGVDFITIGTFTESVDRSGYIYEFTDRTISANVQKAYYRVQATESSGLKYFSSVISIGKKLTGEPLISKVMILGQSVSSLIEISKKGMYTVMIQSASGVLLKKKMINLEEGINNVTIPFDEAAYGTYIISLYDNSRINSKKFIY